MSCGCMREGSGQGRGKRSGHSGHGRTNIYATSLPTNLSDTTVAVAVWAQLAIGCHRLVWIGTSESCLVAELKWQRVRSQVLKWKAKSGTKKTSHRPYLEYIV